MRMERIMKTLWCVVVLVLAVAGPVWAAPEVTVEAEDVAVVAEQSSGPGWVLAGVCLASAIAVTGGGYAIAKIAKACIESTARQPEASGAMFAPMIITAAMIEGAMLLAIILALLAILRL